MNPLSEEDIVVLLQRALMDERGLKDYPVAAEDDALAHLATVCEGDARRALNALEIAVVTTDRGDDGRVHLTQDVAAESIQKKAVLYDHDEGRSLRYDFGVH